MYLYEVEMPRSRDRMNHTPLPLGGFLGESGELKKFNPSELVLTTQEAIAVLKFFWPEKDLRPLGTITDADRGFAQGLLLEAIDASNSKGIVEDIYRTTFMKVPTSFRSLRNMAIKLAKKALAHGWFKRTPDVRSEDLKVYESVRRTIAQKFVRVIDLRLQTGNLIY